MASPSPRPTRAQQRICNRHGVDPQPPDPSDRAGVATNVEGDLYPVNGLRHPPEHGTSGWYLWAGEQWSDDPDFFQPLHHQHIADVRAEVIPYLALPPGWRFLIAPGQVDVWYDADLLDM